MGPHVVEGGTVVHAVLVPRVHELLPARPLVSLRAGQLSLGKPASPVGLHERRSPALHVAAELLALPQRLDDLARVGADQVSPERALQLGRRLGLRLQPLPLHLFEQIEADAVAPSAPPPLNHARTPVPSRVELGQGQELHGIARLAGSERALHHDGRSLALRDLLSPLSKLSVRESPPPSRLEFDCCAPFLAPALFLLLLQRTRSPPSDAATDHGLNPCRRHQLSPFSSALLGPKLGNALPGSVAAHSTLNRDGCSGLLDVFAPACGHHSACYANCSARPECALHLDGMALQLALQHSLLLFACALGLSRRSEAPLDLDGSLVASGLQSPTQQRLSPRPSPAPGALKSERNLDTRRLLLALESSLSRHARAIQVLSDRQERVGSVSGNLVQQIGDLDRLSLTWILSAAAHSAENSAMKRLSRARAAGKSPNSLLLLLSTGTRTTASGQEKLSDRSRRGDTRQPCRGYVRLAASPE